MSRQKVLACASVVAPKRLKATNRVRLYCLSSFNLNQDPCGSLEAFAACTVPCGVEEGFCMTDKCTVDAAPEGTACALNGVSGTCDTMGTCTIAAADAGASSTDAPVSPLLRHTHCWVSIVWDFACIRAVLHLYCSRVGHVYELSEQRDVRIGSEWIHVCVCVCVCVHVCWWIAGQGSLCAAS